MAPKQGRIAPQILKTSDVRCLDAIHRKSHNVYIPFTLTSFSFFFKEINQRRKVAVVPAFNHVLVGIVRDVDVPQFY